MPRKQPFVLETYKAAQDRVKELLKRPVYRCAPDTSVSHLNKTYKVSHIFACCLLAATDENNQVNEDLFRDLLDRRSDFK